MPLPTQTQCFVILAVLCAIELVGAALIRKTTGKLEKVATLRRGQQPIERLSTGERDAAISESVDAFGKTIWAKIHIAVMAYHLPAALCWALLQSILGSDPKTPRGSSLTFYFGFTIFFWFIFAFGALSISNFIRG